jgi:hypothetical protein
MAQVCLKSMLAGKPRSVCAMRQSELGCRVDSNLELRRHKSPSFLDF